MSYVPKYFSEREFQRCSPSCHLSDMDETFLRLLDCVREKAGIPLVLNSAYRSITHEKKMGRSGTSSHIYGKAVDIRCKGYANRSKIIQAAHECGISRIGIATTYIHLDIDDKKSQNVIWLYDGNKTV